ncbi:MAG: SDR family oxidoreductase, partial [Bacteroidota bacterium]
VRDRRRFDYDDFDSEFLKNVEVIEVDFLSKEDLSKLPRDIDLAYYLLHSLGSKTNNFKNLEETIAHNFVEYINVSQANQIIYLSGIVNDEELSQHLDSRFEVEKILSQSNVPTTVLRSGIIIGSGSASFEIIRDLVEKLPVMIAPKWLKTKCQPIAIANVLQYLFGVIGKEEAYNKVFDIGGKDVLTYKEMLLQFAEVRKLKRLIITVPILTPKLSSLWLHFVTSTSYYLARNLVDSLKNEVVCGNNDIDNVVHLKDKFGYKDALKRTFSKIKQNEIISSWKDSFANSEFNNAFISQVAVPEYGCYKDRKTFEFNEDPEKVLRSIWKIGGERGWYYGNWMWKVRGFIDKLVGGVGLRRGRRNPNDLKSGDALDFWRVLYADKREQRLLLFAEMKVPGEAWLEFKIKKVKGINRLYQTATFRPLGLWGRLYWYLVLPFHGFIFNGMAKNLISYKEP